MSDDAAAKVTSPEATNAVGLEPRDSYRAPAGSFELEALLAGDLPQDVVARLQALLVHPLFHGQASLSDAEGVELAYRRAAYIAKSLALRAADVATDPNPLFALHEWVSLVDGVTVTVLSIHYCLALGSILAHGQSRPELEGYIQELERFDSVGVFLATEVGYGNNVASLETRASYDPERGDFMLTSPTPQSFKFMPNTGSEVPKIAVVMARLFTLGRDQGVFPFVVRLRGAGGVECEGVHITRLNDKPGNVLDNAITRFDQVRIPKANLLTGADSVLHEDGRFESRESSRHRRFLAAMDRVQTGRVCFASTAVAMLRGATWIAGRYTAQRLTFGTGRRSRPVLGYLNVQRDVLGALAATYALTIAIRFVQRSFRSRSPETEAECFQSVATIKAVASADAAAWLVKLRERCGAVGLFSENRIMQYWNQVQGIVTAEGDNQLMLLKVGRQLAEQAPRLQERNLLQINGASISAEQCLSLFQFRERCLHHELQCAIDQQRVTNNAFDAWNHNVNRVMELTNAYGDALVGARFMHAIDSVSSQSVTRVLRLLMVLWSLPKVEAHAGWYLSHGCVSSTFVHQLSDLHDRTCQELVPDFGRLLDAFGYDNTILRAPIAESDYIAAYAGCCDKE